MHESPKMYLVDYQRLTTACPRPPGRNSLTFKGLGILLPNHLDPVEVACPWAFFFGKNPVQMWRTPFGVDSCSANPWAVLRFSVPDANAPESIEFFYSYSFNLHTITYSTLAVKSNFYSKFFATRDAYANSPSCRKLSMSSMASSSSFRRSMIFSS